MSFLAKLFIDDQERTILRSDFRLHQTLDAYKRPDSNVRGGKIILSVASTLNDTLFWEWAISPDMSKAGLIRYYTFDGMTKMADFEFYDCFLVDYNETFTSEGSSQVILQLVLSPGVFKYRDLIHKKAWSITDPSSVDVEPTVLDRSEEPEEEEELEKRVIDFYIANEEGDRIENYNIGDIIYLIVKTENMVGETITISLKDKDVDFEYDGNPLPNDELSDYEVQTSNERIELKVIPQQ